MHLARANPFNTPHLQLVRDGLLGPSSIPARAPGTPPHSSNLAATAVEEYSCEYGYMKVVSCGLTYCCGSPEFSEMPCAGGPQKYKDIFNGFSITLKEVGVPGLAKGWAPTFIGYSMQGLCKFGFYEVFEVLYSNMLGEENAYLWCTSQYLAASTSAEFFADIALAPMEAAKVRIQTHQVVLTL
ncbi:Phosphate carrier protein, mitochondrial [Fukomys damarensis]|uniref:Solute carrier family 25 member 3 n=1 Tax=Fukomys damarensis TaxID=885580 RepID=A0A091E552_FUKDA|nr:Phosphate carrier protein, mitochondrial [Fukomys damarensis]